MIRIGLLGATGIAVKAVLTPAALRADTAVVTVAAGDVGRARKLAATHGVPHVHESYDALLSDPDVDAVYVSTHPAGHLSPVLAAVRAGKHALVEKPLCLSAREAELLSLTQRRSGVVVREAVMTECHPWQRELSGLAAEHGLGALREVRTDVRFPRSSRLGYRARPDLGGGVFHDVAPYWLQMLQDVLGLSAETSGHSAFDGPAGTDSEFTAGLTYPDGVRATLECALDGPYRAVHVLRYARGDVTVRDFLLPAAGRLRLNLLVEPSGAAPRIVTYDPVDLYVAQLGAFIESVVSGEDSCLDAAVERARRTEEIYVRALGAAGRPAVETGEAA
ncbi:Gfo/Idh/MocA family oxidoreductase [Streptomyces sp. NPDC033538]|uniref:Gfo/Idh/MocA family protein n=1 Tax=Streptomyces sp. NPDC033538 TaxID=3155367 RepID=UPI0033CBBAF9